MLLYPFLTLLGPTVVASNSKVHLAGWNGTEDPLDVYRKGLNHFENWQSYQSQKNFERQYVVSLIQLARNGSHWLFAGVYKRAGCKEVRQGKGMTFKYDLPRMVEYDEVLGRLIVHHARRTRAPYRFGDAKDKATGITFDTELKVHELRARPLGLPAFPGFKQASLDFPTLQLIVEEAEPSWKTALSAVSGVYLVSDSVAGKLYVGSAGGVGGIWGRWCQYMDGHAGNRELRKLAGERGIQHTQGFRFSILETADTTASHEELLARESHWKEVLLTRDFGLNAN